MTQRQALQLFEEKKVRTVWDDQEEKWYFSIVDVVAILSESANPQTYWRVLKNQLAKEGNETVTNCNAFKMPAADGKMRLTDLYKKTVSGKTLAAGNIYPIVLNTDRVEGAVSGLFSIDESGDLYYFSKGNLQATYGGGSRSRGFATNQYDYIGNNSGNRSVANTSPYIENNGTVNLFGPIIRSISRKPSWFSSARRCISRSCRRAAFCIRTPSTRAIPSAISTRCTSER